VSSGGLGEKGGEAVVGGGCAGEASSGRKTSL
jgi:hypothetical protein